MTAAGKNASRLTMIDPDVGRHADGHVLARYLCVCGAEVIVIRSRVKAGATKSCGCLAAFLSSARATKHGGRRSREYGSWLAMKRRCENHSDKDFPRYGGRGITVCGEWSQSFAAFFAHIGPRPVGATLDRIDPNRGYEPGNVRWATPQEQARNRRGTYVWHVRGKTFQSIGDAARAFSVSEHTVSRWVNGAFDKRRMSQTAPRQDCWAERRHA